MIRSSRKLLCVATSDTVVNTVRLGISLFNPYRFRRVLSALPHTVLAQTEVSEYMEAANRCFQDCSNVRLMPISSVVEIMHILSREFPSSPVLTSVRDSLIRTINTPQRVVELAHAVESMRDFSDHFLMAEGVTANLHLISPRSPSRIRLSRYAQDPLGYLSHFCSSASAGALSKLSPDQLVRLLQVLHSNSTGDSGQVLMECLKNRWNSDLVASSTLVSKVEFVGSILTVCEAASPDVIVLAGEIIGNVPDIVDLLSPDQIILVLHMLTGQASQLSGKALETFRWRLSRDSRYLASIDGHHMTRLLKVMPGLESRERTTIMAQLQVPLMRLRRVSESDLVQICEAFSDLPGSPWVEHPDFANTLFHHIVNRVGMSDETVSRLVRAVVDGVGVTDMKVACNLVDRFAFMNPEIRSELVDSLERSILSATEQSRVGNLVLSKLLSEEGSDFTRIVDNLKTKGSIPLHAQIYNLSIPQLMEIIDLVPSERLADLEMVSEAANYSESTENRVDLLSKLTDRGVPSRALVDSIVGEFSSLTIQDKIDVISCCRRTRVVPTQGIDVEALVNELGTSPLPATKIADLIHSLALLGKMDESSSCCRLIDAFLSATPRGADHANSAGDVLASMLVSLTVPNGKQIDRLLRMIGSDPTSVSMTSRLVIHEMNEVLGNSALSDLLPHLPLTEAKAKNDDLWTEKLVCSESFQRYVIVGKTELSRVDLLSGDRAILLARPEDMMENGELSQLFKFRLFIIGKKCRDVTVQNWMTLVH